MELNIKDASKFIKVARSTVYNKIESGELSRTDSGRLDTSELLRVFWNPDTRDKTKHKAQLDSIKKTLDTERDTELKWLYEQIKILKEALEESKKREVWLMEKVDSLTDTMKLLETPKKDSFFKRLFG